MTRVLLKRFGTGAALLALSGCVHASPYSAAFPEAGSSGGSGTLGRAASAGDLCRLAHLNPGSPAKVYECLMARGRDWDNRGRGIRTQASVVGQMAIPLGIASLGLSAGGDRSDFVPLTAGATTTALAHTGAYARPDQARVYEMATAAYRCLESVVVAWNRADQSEMNVAYQSLDEAVAAALTYLDSNEARTHIDEVEVLSFKAAIRLQRASAHAARNRLGGEIGSELLLRSGEIEGQVREAISARMPDPQVVAASLVGPAAGNPIDTPSNDPPSSPQSPTQPDPSVNGNAADKALADRKNADAFAAAEENKRVVDAVRARMATVNTLADQFDAAANAFKEEARTITVDCAFNPVSVPALVDPGDITLNQANQGSFLIQGGIPPYGYNVLPRDGLSITIQPIGSGWRFDLSASPSSAGPWTIYVNDSSSVNGILEVGVKK